MCFQILREQIEDLVADLRGPPGPPGVGKPGKPGSQGIQGPPGRRPPPDTLFFWPESLTVCNSACLSVLHKSAIVCIFLLMHYASVGQTCFRNPPMWLPG